MRNTSLWFIAAGALLAASCSNEELVAPSPDGTVSFSVEIPDAIGSRAFGDGYSAKTLRYAVYDADADDFLVEEGSASFGSTELSTTVSLQLVNGRNYKIAFFAYYTLNSVYTFNAEAKTVTINYTSMANVSSQRNDYDAFYKMEEVAVKGAISRNVTLKRPVAQINWGTDDYDITNEAVNQAYGPSLRTGIEFTACNTLDLLSGEASGETTVKMKAQNPIDTSYGDFPVDGYKWLNCKYILVPEDAPVMDMKLNLYRGSSTLVNTVEVSNVPVGRNYRTNIYGSLLTSPVNITVVKDPIFETPDNNKEVWQGNATTPKQDEAGNYLIAKASDMAGLAQMVNSGNSLSGKTVLLTTDIDLGNLPWSPIGTKTAPFAGNFDGQNHTVKNLNIDLAGKETAPIGLFGYIWSDIELKNLTIDGANVNALGTTNDAANGTGILVGTFVGKAISNITIKNAAIKAYRWAGGIAGYSYTNIGGCTVDGIDIALSFEYTSKKEWDNCDKAGAIVGIANEDPDTYADNKAYNVNITGYRHIGGLFGLVNGNATAKNNTADNVTITQTFEHNYENLAPGALVSGTIGKYASGNESTTNTATNVTIYKPSIVSEPAQIVEALGNGGYVGIEADLDFTALQGSVTIEKPTIIDLKGNVTVNANQIVNNSELTVKGSGKMTGEKNLISNGTEGKLTIDGGEFETTGTPGQYSPVHAIYSEGDVTINGGTFKAGTSGLNVNLAGWKNHNKTIIVNGGTFIATTNWDHAINLYGNGDADSGNKAVINGGTFIGNFGAGRADNGIDVTINGGTFICKGTYHGFCAGAESFGSENTKVTVNGGLFYAAGSGFALCKANKASMTVKGAVINKTGGNFTLAESSAITETDQSVEVDGTTYTFGYKVVAQ